MTSVVDELERRFLLQEEYLGNCKPVNSITPMVSVTVTVYQHAQYIRECLDGILMQKFDFPFEIIIGEDESIDGSREICMKYAEDHPDKIRLFLRNRQISHCQLVSRTVRFNGIFTRMSARGKYTSICEGDDYWINPNKLRKQYEFLEKNSDCSTCFHNAFISDENISNSVSCFNIPLGRNKFTTEALFEYYWFVPTASIFFRTSALPAKYPEWYLNSYNGDLALLFLLSKNGALGLVEGCLSVYRRNSVNSLSLQVKEKPDFYILQLIDLLNSANLFFDRKYENKALLMCNKLKTQVRKIRIKRFMLSLLKRK